MLTSRRSFITGLVSLMAAPAIVRAGSLMPVKLIDLNEQYLITRKAIDDALYGALDNTPYRSVVISMQRLREDLLPGLLDIARYDTAAARALVAHSPKIG